MPCGCTHLGVKSSVVDIVVSHVGEGKLSLVGLDGSLATLALSTLSIIIATKLRNNNNAGGHDTRISGGIVKEKRARGQNRETRQRSFRSKHFLFKDTAHERNAMNAMELRRWTETGSIPQGLLHSTNCSQKRSPRPPIPTVITFQGIRLPLSLLAVSPWTRRWTPRP